MSARTSLRGTLVGIVALAAVVLTGCSTTMADLPIPGTGVSGDTITVNAEFDEALNLATGATVKVNGVDSGKVQEIGVEGFHAKVKMKIKTDATLRTGATARLRYTTPLGELFVDIRNPSDGDLMADGALMTREVTTTAPTVEDALSQASLLINGGGLAQLQTVTEELNAAIGGREDLARSLLERTRDFLVEANATTDDIDVALTALASVSSTLRSRERVINRAVREIAPAARVLRQNTPGLTKLLKEVRAFAEEADSTAKRTRSGLLKVLDQVSPVLREFVKNKSVYPASLKGLVTAGNHLKHIAPGDYINMSLALKLDAVTINQLSDLFDLLGLPPGIELPELPHLPIPLPILGKAGISNLITSAEGGR